MNIERIDASPVNGRGGQTSHPLLGRGQFGAEKLAVTWVDCAPGSMQAINGHPDNEYRYT